MRLDQGLRFFSSDRTGEVIKLFIIWLFFYQKKKHFNGSRSRHFTSGDARAHSFTNSNPLQIKPVQANSVK